MTLYFLDLYFDHHDKGYILDTFGIYHQCDTIPDSKVHRANMGPTWVLSAPDGPHVGSTNLAITDVIGYIILTHWGLVTHICVNKLTIIGSDNGLSPGRRQAIIWTNAGILLIEPLWTNFSEISIEIHTFSFKAMHLKMSSGKRRPFCLGLNVLNYWIMSLSVSSMAPSWILGRHHFFTPPYLQYHSVRLSIWWSNDGLTHICVCWPNGIILNAWVSDRNLQHCES